MEWLIAVLAIIIFSSPFWWAILRIRANEKFEKEEEQNKQKIKSIMKEKFNIDFNVSFHIGDEFAIDKINDLIYLTYSENTINYIAWVKPESIADYSLSPQYKQYSAKNQAIKGAILAGTAGAVIGAASANDSVPTGYYILSISFKTNNSYKYHHSYTRCSREEGQEVICYIEQAQKK